MPPPPEERIKSQPGTHHPEMLCAQNVAELYNRSMIALYRQWQAEGIPGADPDLFQPLMQEELEGLRGAFGCPLTEAEKAEAMAWYEQNQAFSTVAPAPPPPAPEPSWPEIGTVGRLGGVSFGGLRGSVSEPPAAGEAASTEAPTTERFMPGTEADVNVEGTIPAGEPSSKEDKALANLKDVAETALHYEKIRNEKLKHWLVVTGIAAGVGALALAGVLIFGKKKPRRRRRR